MSLQRIASYASCFETVVTFNYDLTFYWAMLEFNESHGNWFKDAFINGSFDPTWPRLRIPFRAARTTLVFFAHGSLTLGRDPQGVEHKLASSATATGWQTNLLNTITSAWSTGTHMPIFVSEGTAAEKLQSVRRSPYLTSVYDHVLSCLGGGVVVYGLSFASNDQHILEALKRNPPNVIAVSVYGGLSPAEQQAYCHDISAKLFRHIPSARLLFFDSQSAGCWNN